MANFFVVNRVKQFGETKNLLELNTIIGKQDSLPIEVCCQDIKFLNFALYAKQKTRDCSPYTTLTKIDKIIKYQISHGFAIIAIF